MAIRPTPESEPGAEPVSLTEILRNAVVVGGQNRDEVEIAHQKLQSALSSHPEEEQLRGLLAKFLTDPTSFDQAPR